MKIVVATDRSETARHAVAWAADLARGIGGEPTLLQVLAEPAEGAAEQLAADARELEANGLERLCASTPTLPRASSGPRPFRPCPGASPRDQAGTDSSG